MSTASTRPPDPASKHMPLTFDTVTARRELLDRRREVERLSDRLARTERARDSLLSVLSILPEPVEVIGDDLLVHYANDASHNLHGSAIDNAPYYSSLLGKESPGKNCPVVVALLEGREMRLDNGAGSEIVIAPTTLASGQAAVVRYTRKLSDTREGATTGAVPAGDATSLDIESLREVATICAQSLVSERLIARVVPVIERYLGCDIALYYAADAAARRFVGLGAKDADAGAPETLTGDDYTVFRNSVGIDAPYLHIKDATVNSLPESLQDFFRERGVAELILVPAWTKLGRHGAFLLGRSAGDITVRHHKFLNAIGPLVGASIERNNLAATLKQSVSTALDLQRAGMHIVAAENPTEALDRIAHTLVKVLGFDAVTARTTEPDGALNEEAALSYPGRFALVESLADDVDASCTRVMARRKPEFLAAGALIRIARDYDPEPQLVHCNSVSVFPVVMHGECHGVIGLYGRQSREDVMAMKAAIIPLVAHAAAAFVRQRERDVHARLIEAFRLSVDGERLSTLTHQIDNHLAPALFHAEKLAADAALEPGTLRSVETVRNYLNLCHESIQTMLSIVGSSKPATDIRVEEAAGRTTFHISIPAVSAALQPTADSLDPADKPELPDDGDAR